MSATWLQFSFLIPVAATVIGWLVVSRQNDIRTRRQEIRAIIDELRSRCERAVEAADAYWNTHATAAGRASAAIKLKAAFPGMTRILRSAIAAGLDFHEWDLLVNLRQAATGGDFDKKGRRARAADRERILDTSLAAEDLIEAVDAAYFEQFPVLRKRRWIAFVPGFLALSASKDTN